VTFGITRAAHLGAGGLGGGRGPRRDARRYVIGNGIIHLRIIAILVPLSNRQYRRAISR
jgi:hypothetical protein